MAAGKFNAMTTQLFRFRTGERGFKYCQRRAVAHIIRLGIYTSPEESSANLGRVINPGPHIEER